MQEALRALDAACIVPASVGRVSARWMPWVLRVPTPAFRKIASSLLKIDDKARSNMADDLARGVATEIDAICGEVVRLANESGRDAPVNRRITDLITRYRGQPWSGKELRSVLGV